MLLMDEGFTQVVRTYTGPTGATTETTPAGATTCTIEVWSGGASGSHVAAGINTGGGGSGGYQVLAVAVSAGQTMTHVLGGGGAPATLGNPGSSDGGTAVSNGTVPTPFTIGDLGGIAQGGGTGGTGGAGAIMGSTGSHTNGNAGTGGVISGQGGNCPNGGGAGGLNSATNQNAGATPGGGGGGSVATASGAGGPAQVRYTYT